MRRLLRLGFALAALVPVALHAQMIQGIVTDAGDKPVPGVVLILLDSASHQVGRALSADGGEFRLLAPHAGTFRVRSTRIGFRPLLSAPMVLTQGETLRPRLVISKFALALDTIRIQGRNACSMSARDSAAAAWRVWEQVRAALTAGQITARERAIRVNLVSYERTLEVSRRTIVKQVAQVRSELVHQPWREVPYTVLRTRGYLDDSKDTNVYVAPGLDALLDDQFLEDHCFKLTSSDPSRVEVEFEPIKGRRNVVEVRGSAWVDRRSSELRHVEFRYVNASPDIERDAGGDMDFVRFPSGAWVISQWNIRMPDVQLFQRRPGYAPEPQVTALVVSGGQVLASMRGSDTLWSRPPIVFSGTIIDSSTKRPIPAARVALAGTDIAVFSDRRGEFSTAGVMTGSYMVEVATPSLDSIGALKSVPLVITDSMPPVRIAVPTAAQMSDQVCGRKIRDGTIVGTANIRLDSLSRPGIKVGATWSDIAITGPAAARRIWHTIEARTDPSGTYALCDVPLGVPVVIRADLDSAKAAVEVQLSAAQRFARVDLVLDLGKAPVSAFAGFVVADSTHAPIANAQVAIGGKLGFSNDKGEVRIREIPAGPQATRVRRLGYAPLDTTLAFIADETLRRTFELTPLTILDSVLVTARTRDIGMEDFEAHRKLGLGHFITRADLEKNNGRQLSDIVRQTTPSMIPVRMYDGKAYMMNRRTGCYSAVFVDGVVVYKGNSNKSNSDTSANPRFDINQLGVSAIEAVELFAGPAQIPAQYMGLNTDCGVVVIHTRRPDKAKPPL
jgi:hypothetical protein